MDRELENLQHQGLFGINKETFKKIFSHKIFFSQITLAFILPLTFFILFQFLFSNLLFGKLTTGEPDLFEIFSRRPRENKTNALFWIYEAAYLIFLIILSLLSASVVVSSVACIYTANPITFSKVTRVVSKVWKRPLVTFLWYVFFMVCYHGVVFLLLLLVTLIVRLINKEATSIAGYIILFVLYAIGFVYINVVWELACGISVLEQVCGIRAMKKSRRLLKGKMFAAFVTFVVMFVPLVLVIGLFQGYVVYGDDLGMGYRVMIGIGCFLSGMSLILYGSVVETVLYFVCKALHHEVIDQSSLVDHLEGNGGHVGGSKAVQSEQLNV